MKIGEDHDAVDGVLEEADDRRRDERGDQIELQPRMAELERALPRRGQALLFLDTDHRARLRADLEGLLFEQHRAAHDADEMALGVGDRIDRIVALTTSCIASMTAVSGRSENGRATMISERCCSGRANASSRNATRPIRSAFVVDDENISDERVRDDRAQRRNDLGNGRVGARTPPAAAPSAGRPCRAASAGRTAIARLRPGPPRARSGGAARRRSDRGSRPRGPGRRRAAASRSCRPAAASVARRHCRHRARADRRRTATASSVHACGFSPRTSRC